MEPENKDFSFLHRFMQNYNNTNVGEQGSWESESQAPDWKEFKTDLEHVQSQIKDVQQRLNGINLSKDTLENNVEKLKKTVEENKETAQDLKNKFIEGLGLFVAFITFISTNVTIFSQIKNVSIAVFFMGLMLLCILVFLYVFYIIMDKKMDKRDVKIKSSFRNLFIFISVVLTISYFAMLYLEKNISSVLTSYKEGKPICVNCTIDKECQIQEAYPKLKGK